MSNVREVKFRTATALKAQPSSPNPQVLRNDVHGLARVWNDICVDFSRQRW